MAQKTFNEIFFKTFFVIYAGTLQVWLKKLWLGELSILGQSGRQLRLSKIGIKKSHCPCNFILSFHIVLIFKYD